MNRVLDAISRRRVLSVLAGAAAYSYSLGRSAADATDSLAFRAQRRGLFFGSGVSASQLASDPLCRNAVLADCAVIVPTVEMKWAVVEKEQGRFDFGPADSIVAFARQHHLAVRGHPLVWHQNLPASALEAINGQNPGAVMEAHIRTLVDHFDSAVISWDVVNEAIWPPDRKPGGLRASPFYNSLGLDYVLRAFEIARQAKPTVPLFYNEFGIEYASQDQSLRRAATLELLGKLKQRGLVDGLGIQSHLNLGWHFDPKIFREFLASVASLGLTIVLSELDVNDGAAPADPAIRDAQVASHVADYLHAAFDEIAVSGLVVWGLSDKSSWMNFPPWRRRDGAANRGQPLDDAFQRKPMWQAIARSLDQAPVRTAAPKTKGEAPAR